MIILFVTVSGCRNDYMTIDELAAEVTTAPTGFTYIQPTPDTAITPEPAAVVEAVEPTPGLAGIGSGDESMLPTLLAVDDKPDEAAVIPTPALVHNPPKNNSSTATTVYNTQAGDTLPALAARFGVTVDEITSRSDLPATGFLDPKLVLMIPTKQGEMSSSKVLMPDSEVVFSPSGLDLDVSAFVQEAGGYLSTYKEYLNSSGWLDGAGVIEKVAVENSINPRVLLSMLEYRSGWVYGQPANEKIKHFPMGHPDELRLGLYPQLTWAVSQLNVGYYGWREGILTSIEFIDGSVLPAAPELNAGTFGIQYLFARMLSRDEWEKAMYSDESFSQLHSRMFGNPELRAMVTEPLFPATLEQPSFILPIEPDKIWSYTGGPHSAWGAQGARAAIDLSPSSSASGCISSAEWVLSATSGLVVRTGGGVVVLDLDGDGNEQTGWNILYMHIATQDRVELGEFIEQGVRIGHPSCEGGVSTGTHFHMARKYNGEWILAGGPLPLNMDGWQVTAAAQAYKGTLSKGDKTIIACTCATNETYITRTTEITPQ